SAPWSSYRSAGIPKRRAFKRGKPHPCYDVAFDVFNVARAYSAGMPRWPRRTWAASVSMNGSATHRKEPDLANIRRMMGGGSMKQVTTTIKLIALVLLCLVTDTAVAQEAKVTSLMSKALTENPGKEVLMISVEYPPGGSDPVHRHNAQAFVYVLEGSIIMGVNGEKPVTLTAGQTFYEGPKDVHSVGRNASKTIPAKFLVFLLKDKDAPVLIPVKELG